MRKKLMVAVSLALVVVVLVVVLVACSQAGQQAQQEPQDMKQVVQQTEPVTAEPEETEAPESTATPEPEETEAPESTATPELEETKAPESTICSSDELAAVFEMAYKSGLSQKAYYTEEDALLNFELDCLVFKAKYQLGIELPDDYAERYINWRPIQEDGPKEPEAPVAQSDGAIQGDNGAGGSGGVGGSSEAGGPSGPSFSDEGSGGFSIDYGPDNPEDGMTMGTAIAEGHTGGWSDLPPGMTMEEALKRAEELTGWHFHGIG